MVVARCIPPKSCHLLLSAKRRVYLGFVFQRPLSGGGQHKDPTIMLSTLGTFFHTIAQLPIWPVMQITIALRKQLQRENGFAATETQQRLFYWTVGDGVLR